MASKIRLSIVLPAVQVTLTAILTRWADRVDGALFGFGGGISGPLLLLHIFVSELRIIWRGVNAPTFPLCFVSGDPHYGALGFGPGEILYLCAVAALWFLVGRFFDLRKGLELSESRQRGTRRMVVQAICGVWGMVFLGLFLFWMYQSLDSDAFIYTNFLFLLRNRSYSLIAVFLFFLWSLTLIMVNGAALVHSIRARDVKASLPPS